MHSHLLCVSQFAAASIESKCFAVHIHRDISIALYSYRFTFPTTLIKLQSNGWLDILAFCTPTYWSMHHRMGCSIVAVVYAVFFVV